MNEKKRRIIEKMRRELGQIVNAALNDSTVTDILLNPNGSLWVKRLGEETLKIGHMQPSAAEALLATVATSLNTTITRKNPILSGELLIDGSRIEGKISPVVSAPMFSIRKKPQKIFTLNDYLDSGYIKPAQLAVIRQAVREKKNILVVGGTGSGKTTLTNAVINEMIDQNPTERLIIIEDTNEIMCRGENCPVYRASGDSDHTSMDRLLRSALRDFPDRIIVGEVRGGEALTLLKAWNTGHPGGVSTCHADNELKGLNRMEQMISEASEREMQPLIADAIDMIIVIKEWHIIKLLSVEGYYAGQYQTRYIGQLTPVEAKGEEPHEKGNLAVHTR